MSRVRQTIFCLAALAVVTLSHAQTNRSPRAFDTGSLTNLIPPPPVRSSPVEFFQKLLSMSPAERATALADRPPESRKLILAKVHEYLKLDDNERDLRLWATELRWYLTPLLQTPYERREAQLAQVPDNMRPLIITRLRQWDALPPSLKQEFLANEKTMSYVTHVDISNAPPVTARQQEMAEQFQEFIDLTPHEKNKLLGTLSAPERAQMEKTLVAFDQMPADQRATCERNYTKFAGMARPNAEFLSNAEKWAKMSPAERKAWRDLVANVPVWPPEPKAIVPHLQPPQISKANTDAN